MTDRLRGMPTGRMVDPETGAVEQEWFDFLEELVFGQSELSVGTVLSGVNAAQAAADSADAKVTGIENGTRAVTDILVSGRGLLTAEQDAQSENINDVASGGVTVSMSPTFAHDDISGAGTGTTNSVTASATGGTGPYTYAWSKVSGDTFTVNGPSAASTSFSATVSAGETKSAVYKVTATDSLTATGSAQVSVSISETS
ncbi:MAG: hypothetical protein AAGK02_07115 [Pseudomonadota bacterium]